MNKIEKWRDEFSFLEGNDKNSALVDAEIVAQMSRQEQGAWAPLEGVLCKTPIIVTADTGTGEDVKRLNAGYLVDFDNNEIIDELYDLEDGIEDEDGMITDSDLDDWDDDDDEDEVYDLEDDVHDE